LCSNDATAFLEQGVVYSECIDEKKRQTVRIDIDKWMYWFACTAGLGCLVFQIVKAATTGFWLDEGWNSSLLHSYLQGFGWQQRISLPGGTFEGILFSRSVTT